MKSLIKHRIAFIEKWLALPKIYHWAFFVVCLSAVNFSAILDYWQDYQQLQRMKLEVKQQSAELAHQEKLLVALKRHSDRHELSPMLTKQIIALDQQINDLLNGEAEILNYQWDFSSRPILHIQLEGRFQNLHKFLTALSEQQAVLSFAQLEMQKTERGQVQSNVILQLKREE
ncbi:MULTISPECIES: hypothetical protein [Rodentibacter]|uniref:hypothetical protein n=1 Tax=Rodentibacter TaxID=1960084 RepID=UPI001CFC91F0|nr:hypothetical protein [Rodentibacter sp. JRC1]GJI55936.1 competence protein C [Rodentibacter sp. JRC1]